MNDTTDTTDTDTSDIPDESSDAPSETPTSEAPVSEEDFQAEALGPGSPGNPAPTSTVDNLPVSTDVTPAGSPGALPQSIDREYKANQAIATDQAKVGQALADEREAKQTEKENAGQAARDIATQERMNILDSQDKEEEHRQALASANEELKAYQDDVKNFKFHDMFANKSTGSKILATIFSAVGGGASVYAKQPNMALAEIDRAEDMDYRKQRDELMQKEKFAEYKRQGVTDMQGQFDKDYAKLQVQQAHKLQSIADYAKGEIVKRGGSPEEAQNNVIVAGLTAKAEKARTDALMKTYEAEMRMKAKAKAKGVGGGTFNPNADAMLANMAADPKTSPGEIARFMAERYKTPKEYTRAMNLVKEERANVAKGITEGTQSERAVRQDVTQWMVANDWTKKAKAHDELDKLDRKLQGNPDPITVASALMELDVAARGGTATGASMSMFQSHLGGLKEKVAGWIESGKTGNLSEGQIKTVRTALAAAKKAAKEEGTDAKKSFDAEFSDVPAAKRRADSMFGRYGGTTGEADKAAVGKGEASGGIPDGTRGKAKDGTPVVRKGGKWVADG